MHKVFPCSRTLWVLSDFYPCFKHDLIAARWYRYFLPCPKKKAEGDFLNVPHLFEISKLCFRTFLGHPGMHDLFRQQDVECPIAWSRLRSYVAFCGEAACVESHCCLEMLALDVLKTGIPSYGVGAKNCDLSHCGSVLILRERDLELQRPL